MTSTSPPAASAPGTSSNDLSFAVQFGPNAPPVRRSPTALARRFYQICLTMTANALVATRLTPLQYGVIAFLNRQDGDPGIDQNGLAARMGVERSHLSLLIEQLAAMELIEQRVNGADRRARLLHLTPKGEKLHKSLRPSVIAANDRALEPLSPQERELFVDMLIRVIGTNVAHAQPGAGRRKPSARRSPSRSNGEPNSGKK